MNMATDKLKRLTIELDRHAAIKLQARGLATQRKAGGITLTATGRGLMLQVLTAYAASPDTLPRAEELRRRRLAS